MCISVMCISVVWPASCGFVRLWVSGVAAGDLWMALGGTREHWSYICLPNYPWDGMKNTPKWQRCSEAGAECAAEALALLYLDSCPVTLLATTDRLTTHIHGIEGQ